MVCHSSPLVTYASGSWKRRKISHAPANRRRESELGFRELNNCFPLQRIGGRALSPGSAEPVLCRFGLSGKAAKGESLETIWVANVFETSHENE